MKKDDKHNQGLEEQYPGIEKQFLGFKNARLPVCPYCGSEYTASVQVGFMGRTICIAAATSKIALIANGPKPGEYRCNSCRKYHGEAPKLDGISKSPPRPQDKSLQAYKDFMKKKTGHQGGKTPMNISEKEWKEQWRNFWDDALGKK